MGHLRPHEMRPQFQSENADGLTNRLGLLVLTIRRVLAGVAAVDSYCDNIIFEGALMMTGYDKA